MKRQNENLPASTVRQKTLKRAATLTGVGLHTGETTTYRFLPAPPDTGVRIVRMDLPGQPEILVGPAAARLDSRDLRRTVLRAGEAEAHTVEHVLSALVGLEIDNVRIEASGLEAPEPPDGSARAIVDCLLEAGTETQEAPRRFLEVREAVSFEEGPVQLHVLPHDGLRISFTIDYDNPLVGTQYLCIDLDPETYRREIAPARTFAFYEDVEQLRAAGMIRGGTLQNAVVVKDAEILSDEALRFRDEFVRHKILDLLGDLALLGQPLRGHVHAVRSGHSTNARFVQKLWESLEGPARHAALLQQVHFDINDIERIMPHRYPFLLVDKILRLEPGRQVVGLKNVTMNEPFFVGHFPGHPIMPGVLLLEAMAQTGGVLLLYTVAEPEKYLVYFMAIDNARFRRPVLPGDQVVFEMDMAKLKGRICRMKGRAYVRGVLVCEAEFMSSIVDR